MRDVVLLEATVDWCVFFNCRCSRDAAHRFQKSSTVLQGTQYTLILSTTTLLTTVTLKYYYLGAWVTTRAKRGPLIAWSWR